MSILEQIYGKQGGGGGISHTPQSEMHWNQEKQALQRGILAWRKGYGVVIPV